ncbi:unnamed protein product [Polarella glacialis]|uniref:Uncharacterized protein n=1 Tax=Polarella glacialis TaxID=89957 RepID=A0A813J5C8_POLGL|nr:unnamed protein product [Polarella glacialis]
MAPLRSCLPLAAGGAAAMLLVGAPAFLTPGSLSLGENYVPERVQAQGVSAPMGQQGTDFSSPAGAVSLSAAGALALGAVICRSSRSGAERTSKLVREATVVKDAKGRFRFDTPQQLVLLVASEQPGITAPLGFFDPLGFTKNPLMTSANDPNGFRHLRESEIKHGRVAMMAAIGSVTAHFWHFPVYDNVPTGLAALNDPQGAAGFTLLVVAAGLLEISFTPGHPALSSGSQAEPGSYGDPFKFNQYTPEMRSRELNNGRMAMFAIMGQIVAELQTGLDPAQQAGL